MSIASGLPYICHFFIFQFQCCMSGWKQVKGVDLCIGPCCDGYHEVIEYPPILSEVVYCKKNAARAMRLKPTMGWPIRSKSMPYWQKK